MNGPVKISRLKRALPGSSKPIEGIHSAIIQQKPNTIKAIVRILLRNPQDDYYYASYTDRGILAVQKSSFFKVVSVQQFNCDDIIQQARILSSIQHPNVASAYDVYCYNEQNFLVMDYLSLRITHLETQEHELEEWEIATIVSEVLKGVVHLSSLKVSCKDLCSDNIGLSLDGELKLVLDPDNIKHDPSHESPRTSQAILDFPIFAEIIEEMMLSRYHLELADDRFSKDARSFLSCTLSGSLESLMNHCFLHLAVSPRSLIPRIRYSYEIRGRAAYKPIAGDLESEDSLPHID